MPSPDFSLSTYTSDDQALWAEPEIVAGPTLVLMVNAESTIPEMIEAYVASRTDWGPKSTYIQRLAILKMERDVGLRDLTSEKLSDYIDRHFKKKGSREQTVTVLHGFYRWANDAGLLTNIPTDVIRERWAVERYGKMMDKRTTGRAKRGTLADRYIVPPLSLFDGRARYWVGRKRSWLDLGIESELGRDATVNTATGHRLNKVPEWDDGKYGAEDLSPHSVFDPVLCEIAYRWYCPKGGAVLDPFAGGSVRGLVASLLKRHYVGVELREEQVEANCKQDGLADPAFMPKWIHGDSLKVVPLMQGEPFDFLFTCPPYFDLEVYSEDPADLSFSDTYDQFLRKFGAILSASVKRLADNRFAIIVMADVRDKNGMYRGLVTDTVQLARDAGLSLYNDSILLSMGATAALYAARPFESSRKLAHVHQNVLTFVKGDPKIATELIGVPSSEWFDDPV